MINKSFNRQTVVSSDEEKAHRQMTGNPEVVIVRFGGEIGIKGKWTRRHYEKQVLKNINED